MSPRDAFLERADEVAARGLAWAGLPRDALAYLLTRSEGGYLLVVDDEDAAEALADSLLFFAPNAEIDRFYDNGGRPYSGFGPPREVVWARRRAMVRADLGQARWVIATAAALASRVPTAAALAAQRVTLRPGGFADREALLAQLSAWGYWRVGAVDAPGTAALRGDVLDVWPVWRDLPVRIDFFDDEIESVRALDPETQRRLQPLREVEIHAATEEVLDDAARDRLNTALAAAVSALGFGLNTRRQLLEDLRAGLRPASLGDYLPALVETRSPTDVFSKLRAVTLSPDDVSAALRAWTEDARRRWHLLDEGERPLATPDSRYDPAESVLAALSSAQPVVEIAPPEVAVDLGARVPTGFGLRGADLAPAVARLRALAADGLRVGVAVEEGRLQALQEIFAHHNTPLAIAASTERLRREEIMAVVGTLHQGFVAEASGLAIVPASALFGNRAAATRARRAHALFTGALRALSEIKEGDLVVHRVHGLGRYLGVNHLDLGGGVFQDFVRLEYRDGDTLYTPATQLQDLSRLASDRADHRIKLDKLGGTTWTARKRRVKDSLLGMATELLALYARRTLAERPAIPAPGPLYAAVEATFPWDETPDQRRAIEEIHADLDSPHPMDRLIAGDVGFGKTEVSVRAAARIAEAGKQVAVLCPTTILAAQHGKTFGARLIATPLRVEVLSRFTSPQDEKRILSDLSAGKVDILIGTSRLLGRGVRFADLGLVVVDEEHRFGVKQKERLKRWRAEVDVLAMSSTPIPRTLEAALTGVRTLSVMKTPPEQRLAVRTVLGKDGELRLRELILPELAREGQVFVVHNRVESIDRRAAEIATWVPEARVGVAHGQLDDDALEAVMLAFVQGDIDVLVASTLIESGVDLPNVNTMIIDDAHQLGLAQLHQLRGRVGRGDRRATAVLLAPEELSREARKRLQVLLENAHLGGGLEIAAADLELRGAGNLLGDAQSGNIHEVGYEVWLELLDEAIEDARGHREVSAIEPTIEVKIPAFLPEKLLPDLRERLSWYQRISSAPTPDAVDEVLTDLEGWVGELPPEVRNLGGLVQTRLLAKALGITRVSWMSVRVTLEAHPRGAAAAHFAPLAQEKGKRMRVIEGDFPQLEVRILEGEREEPFTLLRWIFTHLVARVRADKRNLLIKPGY